MPRNRASTGDTECVLCGRMHHGYTKYPVCFDCAMRMAQDGRESDQKPSVSRLVWNAEEYTQEAN